VANYLSHTVTVINGVDHSTNTVAVGLNPGAIIANLTSDEVYVANEGDNTLTIIDGADYSTTTLNVGGGPAALTLNPVTNKLYVANALSHTVSVIDGGGGQHSGHPLQTALRPDGGLLLRAWH
jgi:YVTN family beta-propeller protein